MSRTVRKNRKTGKSERDDYNRRTHTDPSCAHHGGCPWCESGRLVKDRRKTIEDYEDEDILGKDSDE